MKTLNTITDYSKLKVGDIVYWQSESGTMLGKIYLNISEDCMYVKVSDSYSSTFKLSDFPKGVLQAEVRDYEKNPVTIVEVCDMLEALNIATGERFHSLELYSDGSGNIKGDRPNSLKRFGPYMLSLEEVLEELKSKLP